MAFIERLHQRRRQQPREFDQLDRCLAKFGAKLDGAELPGVMGRRQGSRVCEVAQRPGEHRTRNAPGAGRLIRRRLQPDGRGPRRRQHQHGIGFPAPAELRQAELVQRLNGGNDRIA